MQIPQPTYEQGLRILKDDSLDFWVSFQDEDRGIAEVSFGNKVLAVANNVPCALGDAIYKAWEMGILTPEQQQAIAAICKEEA